MSSSSRRGSAPLEKEFKPKVTTDTISPREFPESTCQFCSSATVACQEPAHHDVTKQPRPKGVLRYQERLRSSSLDSDPTFYGSSSGKLQHHVTFSCESCDRESADASHSGRVQEDTKCAPAQEETPHRESSNDELPKAVIVTTESFDNFETPPSTPPQPFGSKKSFLCSIDEEAPLNLEHSNRLEVRSKSRSPSRDSTSSKDSCSSGEGAYEDAKEYFQLRQQNSREVSPPVFGDSKENTYTVSGFTHGSIPPSTLGLYQRRRMKRHFLRLQSLEEVAAGVVYSDAVETPTIPEDEQEEESGGIYTEKSPDLPPLTWGSYPPGLTDKPPLKPIRRHYSTGDAVIMSGRRPNQLLFPPRHLFVGGVRKSHR
ncbi:hypothetical protein BsWGS_19478 [Bradybaena similaris]